MQTNTSLFGQKLPLPAPHQKWLALLTVVVVIAGIWSPPKTTSLRGELQLPQISSKKMSPGVSRTPLAIDTDPSQDTEIKPNNEYQIEPGDTLGGIFTHLQLSHNQMRRILEADQSLALDTLLPGNTLRFWLDTENNINKLQVMFHPGYFVDFTRHDADTYESKEVIIEGQWNRRILGGEIEGSLYLSAIKAGLSPTQIDQITRLFKDKINFARSLRAGDEFQVIVEEQYIDDQATGENRILSIRIVNRSNELSAFLFDDGNYYDRNGQSLVRAFVRRPVQGNYRISSGFNPKRKHPITGRISPHNGTDFAVPPGTPVYATGDGIVTRVVRHPYAGLYIELKHGGSYKTRFLHLNKALVKKGQKVSRGQKIALSGNTGRSTGPHLHYEFHINGRPVDAMRANIPMASSVAKKALPAFKKSSQQLLAAMQQNSLQRG
jgi:murein DD-endopeptidase